MCGAAAAIGPAMSIAGTAISAVGEKGKYDAQVADIANYNNQVYENAINANRAASQKYGDEGYRYTYNMRDLQQQGYKSAMEGRRATGTAIASAGSSGVYGSSASVENILGDIDQQQAENLNRIKTKQDDSTQSFINNTKSIETEAKNRQNSMRYKQYPQDMTGLSIASGIFGAIGKAGSSYANSQ
jgi:hypothetical protein